MSVQMITLRRTLGSALKAGNVARKICENNPRLTAPCAYLIYKMRRECEDLAEYLMSRLTMLFGEGFSVEKLTEEEEALYLAIVNSEIDITLPLEGVDVFQCPDLMITPDEMGLLAEFLNVSSESKTESQSIYK